MKVFIYSAHRFEKPFLEKAAQGKHELSYSIYALNANTTKLAQGYDAVAVFTSDEVSAEVVTLLYHCGVRFIVLRSVGYDHIDIDKAKELGIKVANVPAYSPYAIAEHTVALLMALNRKIVLGQQLMKKNNFNLDDLVGFDLHGKTVGIVGTGKIGTALAYIMKGFGCKLLGFDIKTNEELVQQTTIQYTSLEELCRESDVISINCPLTIKTKYLFNKNLFSIMKSEAIIINTARGSIVNTKDLVEALENKTIAGAGLDVYENEKPIFFRNHLNNVIIDSIFDKLRSFPNVLITGHQAFLTNEALTGIADTTFSNINDWANGKKCLNEL
jgi:D-lactate dehydrogenase